MASEDVIVKAEYHSSRGDFEHERDILVDGVDHLILEGPENEADYGLFQQWYAFAMLLTQYLFMRILYTDSTVLEDIADAQDADIVKTRESDASILENSHLLMRIAAAALFFIMFFASALFGIAGIHLIGVSLLIGSAMIPVLLLRIHESVRSSGNRNEQMADLIEEAAEQGGRVVAIVGAGHADRVCNNLPDWINPIREDPRYSVISWQHFKDIAYPSFVSISVLWVFYSLFIIYVEFVWTVS